MSLADAEVGEGIALLDQDREAIGRLSGILAKDVCLRSMFCSRKRLAKHGLEAVLYRKLVKLRKHGSLTAEQLVCSTIAKNISVMITKCMATELSKLQRQKYSYAILTLSELCEVNHKVVWCLMVYAKELMVSHRATGWYPNVLMEADHVNKSVLQSDWSRLLAFLYEDGKQFLPSTYIRFMIAICRSYKFCSLKITPDTLSNISDNTYPWIRMIIIVSTITSSENTPLTDIGGQKYSRCQRYSSHSESQGHHGKSHSHRTKRHRQKADH